MASDIICRSLYPYLCDKLWNRFKTAPKELETYNSLKKIELEEKLANFSLSENTFNEEIPSQSNSRDDLRLVIIGKTGQGKSATANTILGKTDSFVEDNTSTSVTRESRRITELVDGRKISVMDTPGLQDTNLSNKRILKELAKITTLFPDGVHAFVYVMSTANPRFTAEDKNVLDLIEKTFGGHFKNYCLLVYSHGDSALKDEDLDTYRKKQMAIGQATSGNRTQQYDRQDSRGKEQEQEQEQGQDQDQNCLAKFIDELDWKMLAIDNKTSIPFEEERNRKQIVAMVDRMRIINSPEIYTNDMFFKAQQEREAMKQKGLKKGWDPSIMSKVETILAANPDISREQLQAEVRRQLQVEQEERLEKEQREMQERREREFLQQQEFERQKQLQREEIKKQRLVAEKQEKQAKEIQLQKEEWEKQQKKDKEEFERLQKQNEEKWERKFREDQQRRQKQEEDMLRRRKEEESMQKMQKEKKEAETQEQFRREQIQLENMLLKIKKEELERQMQRKRELQERKKIQEEERKQFELRQRQEKEHRLREMEELERRRQEQLKREELEREETMKREDMERERERKKKQEEQEKAEWEKSQQDSKTEEQVNVIADEHMRLWEKAFNGIVAYAKKIFGW